MVVPGELVRCPVGTCPCWERVSEEPASCGEGVCHGGLGGDRTERGTSCSCCCCCCSRLLLLADGVGTHSAHTVNL